MSKLSLQLVDFVLFKLPNASKVELWDLDNSLDSGNIFRICSFDGSVDLKMGIAHQQEFTQENLPPFELKPACSNKSKPTSKKEYLKTGETFLNGLKKNQFQKLILSRIKSVAPITDLRAHFLYLCNKFPTAFVYVWKNGDEIWMGASPEKLLQVEDNELSTVALAGTKSTSENRKWTKKEQDEHNFVVDYIAQSLEDISPKQSETYTVRLKEIEHLKTDFTAQISIDTDIEKIIKKLHPTPAVCGLPKQETQAWILEKENHQRKFYTGFIGIQTAHNTRLFVNLRCAQVFSNATILYLGGGLTAESDLEAEWQETELKSKALF